MEFNWHDENDKTTIIVKKQNDNFKIAENMTEYDL
jgi:hypothetical protein